MGGMACGGGGMVVAAWCYSRNGDGGCAPPCDCVLLLAGTACIPPSCCSPCGKLWLHVMTLWRCAPPMLAVLATPRSFMPACSPPPWPQLAGTPHAGGMAHSRRVDGGEWAWEACPASRATAWGQLGMRPCRGGMACSHVRGMACGGHGTWGAWRVAAGLHTGSRCGGCTLPHSCVLQAAGAARTPCPFPLFMVPYSHVPGLPPHSCLPCPHQHGRRPGPPHGWFPCLGSQQGAQP